MDAKLHQIQNLIIKWFYLQKSPVKDRRVREICKGAYRELYPDRNTNGVMYECFYPLVRAGYIECGLESDEIKWCLSKPMALYTDYDNIRHWFGINLTCDQKDKIETDVTEDPSDNMELHTNVIYWETTDWIPPLDFPIVNNPSPQKVLKLIPKCSPELFAKEANHNISRFKYFFKPFSGWTERNTPLSPNGYYKMSEEVYSPRIYFRNGKTYNVNKDLTSNDWAMAMSFIDSGTPIACYQKDYKTIEFFSNVPIVLSRILFYNGIFSCLKVNSRRFYNVRTDILLELNRIFRNSIRMEQQ